MPLWVVALGAVLAVTHFSPETALIPAIFAIWCVVTASLLARYWGRKAESHPHCVKWGFIDAGWG